MSKRVIFEFELTPELGIQSVGMPQDARILCVREQLGLIYVCVEVQVTALPVGRSFHLRWSGIDYEEDGDYVGTVRIDGIPWHVFDLGEV